jgi:hypothetical protein
VGHNRTYGTNSPPGYASRAGLGQARARLGQARLARPGARPGSGPGPGPGLARSSRASAPTSSERPGTRVRPGLRGQARARPGQVSQARASSGPWPGARLEVRVRLG